MFLHFRIVAVSSYNSNGPIVSLVGNGSGFAYCEQITITRVATISCTDGVQINSTGGAYNVNNVVIGFCRFVNYSGYAVNNVAQGNELYLIGTLCVPSVSGHGVTGNVTCTSNPGIPDNIQ
jgi:hypothetical protein